MKNREQRRKMEKESSAFKYLNSPCSINEAAQIARGVAEDVVSDYKNTTGHLQIAISLQLEVLKELLIKSGAINEDEFKERYIQRAEEFNKLQQAAMSKEETDGTEQTPKMSASVDEIEVKKM